MEVTELLKIINQIRAKYPHKQNISTLDILKVIYIYNLIKHFKKCIAVFLQKKF